MANRTRAQLSTDSLGFFPNNNTQLISPQDLRDWITNGIESFVTQKDTSEFQNAFYECRGSAITATSGTTNLALATGNFVHITGSGPISITSFGLLPAGSRFVLCFDIPVTIVYNATTLIIPGAANIVTVAGDCIMLISEGSGAWRLIGYFPSTGLPVGTVTAVTASAPLSSTGGNAPDLSIPQANGSTDGFLDSADWTTFNGKQDALTLTTTGTSGPATLTGSTLNIPQYSGGGGGTPGGVDTEIQYNNGGAFGGVSDLTWDDINNQLTIKNPRIGQSVGNGHFHMHNSTSGPPGIADYLTVNWEKSNRSVGFRYEQETFLSYLKFLQPTANRTYTLPDASGNVLVDTVLPSLTNGVSEGQIRFKEAVANGTNYIALKAPATVAADTTFTLPDADGTPGTVLQTNGSGILSWISNGGALSSQYLKNTQSTNVVTNPTVNTIVETLIIPAGTFTSNNAFMLNVKMRSTVTVSTIGYTISINTSATIGGINLVSTNMSAGNAAQNVITNINLFGGGAGNSTRYMQNGFTSSSAIGTEVTTIDWSVTQYIVFWVTGGASLNRNVINVLIGTTPL